MFKIRTVGQKQIEANLLRAERTIKQALGQGLYAEASRIMDDSKAIAPRIEGKLQETGKVHPPEYLPNLIRVGFGFPEFGGAVKKLHENLRAGKTGGVGPKGQKYQPGTFATSGGPFFLTRAVAQNIPLIVPRTANEILRVMLGTRL